MSGVWQVYLVQCADGSYYCGVTTDLDRRLAEHNGLAPGGARYTRSRRPVRLAAAAAFPDRASACRAEWRVKRLSREKKAAWLREQAAKPEESGREPVGRGTAGGGEEA